MNVVPNVCYMIGGEYLLLNVVVTSTNQAVTSTATDWHNEATTYPNSVDVISILIEEGNCLPILSIVILKQLEANVIEPKSDRIQQKKETNGNEAVHIDPINPTLNTHKPVEYSNTISTDMTNGKLQVTLIHIKL